MSKCKSCYLISMIFDCVSDIGNFNNIKSCVALLKLGDFSGNIEGTLQYLVFRMVQSLNEQI